MPLESTCAKPFCNGYGDGFLQGFMIAALIVLGVLLFGFVIFFHELGHFLMAKASGIRVNEFSIGMGPALFRFGKGETQYTLRLLPIGGYCAMEGEDEESTDARAFGNQPVWQRILVVIAGGVFNILLGLVLMFLSLLPQETFSTTLLAQFEENSVLQAAGAQRGDQIVQVDDYKIYNASDLSFAMAMADPDDVSFVVKREDTRIPFEHLKMPSEEVEGRKVLRMDFWVFGEKRNAQNLLTRSATETFSLVRLVIHTIKGMFTGRFGLNDLAGPVGTAQAISQVTGAGLASGFGQAFANLLNMIIMITVNLGVVNLLPLPALDGGRLLFLLWEAVTRHPVPPKYEGVVHLVGFGLLILLMVAVTFNDILRLFRG